MKTPRQEHSEGREQLEREATITVSVKAALPDGTVVVADWPAEWEAPTYEELDTGSGDLDTGVHELAFDAMGELVRVKLGPYPLPTAEEEAVLRSKMIAIGMDPDDPDGPLARLKATLAKE